MRTGGGGGGKRTYYVNDPILLFLSQCQLIRIILIIIEAIGIIAMFWNMFGILL